ncbi:uncharacterized protein LOC126845735 [Adelges cooleyi]|uniref:uncharacterized protein LOC126845735 n=1 Tax=Adelges cooleyi TaxID=133065 RepID=UPI00217F306E|nr:uncharacterized protein LOC126845735 [Adelges cooleyi]
MILKSFVLLITINSFAVPEEDGLLKCYYYRYMLYSFTLHGIYITDTFNNTKNVSHEQLKLEIKVHEDELRTQGAIVIGMLENLKKRKTSSDIYDLMKLNLYLNNVFETPLIRTTHAVDYPNGRTTVRLTSNSKEYIVSIKESFQTFHEYIGKDIREHVESKCKSEKPIDRDAFSECPKPYVDLNYLLPENFYDIEADTNKKTFIEAMKTFNDKTVTLSHLLATDKQKNSIFNPKKMLFQKILNRETYKDGVLQPPSPDKQDTSLDLLRNVSVDGRLIDGQMVNITILFEMIKRSYEPHHIQHFQRQVLAASIYPVLNCIGSYLLLFKQMYYNGKAKFGDVDEMVRKYETTIDRCAVKIQERLNQIIDYKLYPARVQTHLECTAAELSKLRRFENKKSIQTTKLTWIETLYRRCSLPMQLNLLIFDEYDVASMNIDTEDKFVEMLENLKRQTSKLDEYIPALGGKEEDFLHVGRRNPYFSHEYMFDDKLTFDIVLHYKDAYDKILKHISRVKAERSSKRVLIVS